MKFLWLPAHSNRLEALLARDLTVIEQQHSLAQSGGLAAIVSHKEHGKLKPAEPLLQVGDDLQL